MMEQTVAFSNFAYASRIATYVLPTQSISLFYLSQMKQRFFVYKILTDYVLQSRRQLVLI
jgi:hypothetical protein